MLGLLNCFIANSSVIKIQTNFNFPPCFLLQAHLSFLTSELLSL
jgi:hypothetical protein